MKTKFTDAELEAAYDMCRLVKSNSDNVLASGEISAVDKEWSQKATKFIKAYEMVQAAKIAKSGKGGYMGDALLKLEGIRKTLNKISK
jgi:hypothetical protein